MAVAKRALGRGLSALIPDEEMELLRRVARDESANAYTASERPASKSLVSERPASRASKASVEVLGARTNSGKSKKANSSAKVAQAMAKFDLSSLDVPEVPQAGRISGSATQGSALLDTEDVSAEDVSTPAGAAKSGETVPNFILISDIQPNPYQPRRSFDESELSNLAASITEHGIIQPIVVRPAQEGDKPYQLVAGERRWRASQRAGLQQIPAIVRPVNDLQALELALIENVQRHDISAIDAALAYRRLSDDFQLSQEDISRRVGKSRSAVANTMRLLDLQPEIRKAIEDGQLSEGHGRAILLAQGDGARRALFRRVTRDHLSVREVERLAKAEVSQTADSSSLGKQSKGTIQGEAATDGKTRAGEFDATHLATQLEKRLGTRLKVQQGARGGRIVIEFSSVQELQRLAELLLPS